MKSILTVTFSLLCSAFLSAQSYAPQAGEPGSTAVPRTSTSIKSWATDCAVVRGLQQINGSQTAYASAGVAGNAIGDTSGVVSLGDGGTATLTFAKPITNGPGFDFAIFENGFVSNFSGLAFLELAFVEVSSDGINFFRFPSHNEYPSDFIENSTEPGGPGFASMDARYLNNFAGKYLGNYGTPFDISDLPDNSLLDKTKITHVKIIDVIGTNIEGFRTYDSFGNIAIDPFPTPFVSSGFDLDAVGVINEFNGLAVDNVMKSGIEIFPNPVVDFIHIKTKEQIIGINIYSISGQKVNTTLVQDKVDVKNLAPGNYILEVITPTNKVSRKFIKK